MRRCLTCKATKPLSAFAIKRGTARNRECKSCKNTYNKTWYAKNRRRQIRAAGINSRRYKMERRGWLWKLKAKPCRDCRRRFPAYVMDFDHVRGRKLGNISTMHSKKRILAEIAKCDLICSNCHRVRTFNRLNARSPMDGKSSSKRL